MARFSLSQFIEWSARWALHGPAWLPARLRHLPLKLAVRLETFRLVHTNHGRQ